MPLVISEHFTFRARNAHDLRHFFTEPHPCSIFLCRSSSLFDVLLECGVVNLYVVSTAAARGVTDSCRSEGRGYRVHIPERGRVDAFMQIPLVELEVRMDLVGEKEVSTPCQRIICSWPEDSHQEIETRRLTAARRWMKTSQSNLLA
jgi:hypothetical protein